MKSRNSVPGCCGYAEWMISLTAITMVLSGCNADRASLGKQMADGMSLPVKSGELAQEKSKWSISNSSQKVSSSLLSSLPRPEVAMRLESGGPCEAKLAEPKSAQAKNVQNLGWHVTNEERQGAMTVVAFFGSADDGTSGDCEIHDANIAVFEGEALVADIYNKNKKEKIGDFVVANDGIIRIQSSGVTGIPLADLEISRERKNIVVRPLPKQEAFCNGNVRVPTIYGLPVSKARKTLAEYGWRPSGTPNEDAGVGIEAYRDLGLSEYSDCSGTGIGFCSLDYANGRAKLSVSAAGDADDQEVVSYEVDCSGSKAR